MKIGNMFFMHKDIHKKTWLSPDGSTRNEIDYKSVRAYAIEKLKEDTTAEMFPVDLANRFEILQLHSSVGVIQ